MRRRRLIDVVATAALFACGPTATVPAPQSPSQLAVGQILGAGETTGFERATAPRAFEFPRDHGPHPGFRSEWWYFTGNLRARQRRFGYQMTIFRQALTPPDAVPGRVSAWASRQVYMGHLAITDVDGRRFVATERLAREGLGLAGAAHGPLRIWVEGWQMIGAEGGDGGPFSMTLRARSGGEPVAEREAELALDLVVQARRGPVVQGDAGRSAKGPEPGNASYYYSITRMPTAGTLTIAGTRFDVTGESWFDREWSTSALGPDLAGWDWLALHLSDGRDLMVYRLRRKDGGAAAESRATVIDSTGRTRVMGPDAFSIETRSRWHSPHTGARYPTRLGIQVPSEGLSVEVAPLLDDQELRLSVHYWEGAVDVGGQARGQPISGSGYLELTGYETQAKREAGAR